MGVGVPRVISDHPVHSPACPAAAVSVPDGRLTPWHCTSTSPSGPTRWPTGSPTLLATPLADPFAREVVVVPARGVERWVTQRLSPPARGGCAGGGRRLRRRRLRDPALARLDAARQGRRRPVGARPAGVAAARGRRRVPGRDRLRGLTAHLGHGGSRTTSARPAATRWPDGWRDCSRRTPSSVRPWSPTGARVATPTGPGARSTPTCAGRPSCGAGCSPAWAPRRPTSGTRTTAGAAARRRRRPRPAAAALPLRPHPAARHRGRAAAGPRRPARRAPLAAAGLPRAVARRSRPRRRRARCRAPPTPSADLVGHPLLASLGRDSRELRRALGDVPTVARRVRPRPCPTRCSAGSSTTCAPTPPPAPTCARGDRSATGRCRSTPATARPARSTCCARCWSACSRTTRPSSRATSS